MTTLNKEYKPRHARPPVREASPLKRGSAFMLFVALIMSGLMGTAAFAGTPQSETLKMTLNGAPDNAYGETDDSILGDVAYTCVPPAFPEEQICDPVTLEVKFTGFMGGVPSPGLVVTERPHAGTAYDSWDYDSNTGILTVTFDPGTTNKGGVGWAVTSSTPGNVDIAVSLIEPRRAPAGVELAAGWSPRQSDEYTYSYELLPTEERVTITAPTVLTSTVVNETPAGVVGSPFTSQTKNEKTPYGLLLDGLCATKYDCSTNPQYTDDDLTALQTAADASRNLPWPVIELTPDNVASTGEGKLLTVAHSDEDATVFRYKGTRRYLKSPQGPFGPTGPPEYANMPEMDKVVIGGSMTNGTDTYRNGFQLLTNLCNNDALDIVAATQNGDNSDVAAEMFVVAPIAGVVASDTFASMDDRPWGVTGPTSEIGFYNQPCPPSPVDPVDPVDPPVDTTPPVKPKNPPVKPKNPTTPVKPVTPPVKPQNPTTPNRPVVKPTTPKKSHGASNDGNHRPSKATPTHFTRSGA